MELSRARRRLLRRIANRRGREAEAVVLLEGPRAITAALRHGAEPLFALVEEGAGPAGEPLEARAGGPGSGIGDTRVSPRATQLLSERGVDLVSVPPEVFREFSDTETPQGLLALVREPTPPSRDLRAGSRILVLDALQDPGNTGTLLRAATAFGVDGVLALDGTVDVWNPKVVRASAGHAFALPIRRSGWEDALAAIRDADLPLVVADPDGEDLRGLAAASAGVGSAPAVSSLGRDGVGWALLVGNEGAGPRPHALEAADVRVTIPMTRDVDSLNAGVAGSVLLWALGPGAERPGAPPTSNERER